MQPGRETNLPSSSGNMPKGMLARSLFAFNGFTVTVGMVLLLFALYLFWQFFFSGKRRR